MRNDDADDEPGDKRPEDRGGGLADRLNALLDRSFFDPSAEGREGGDFLSGFRRLFNEDPGLGEAVYVGGVFALLLWFAQRGVSVYKHCYFSPDALCPWEVTPSLDSLLGL